MIASFIHPSSYFGIALFLVLTGCGLPLPEEVAIVVAGVLSAQGHLRWELALLACLVGAIIGDCIMYAIGHRWGHGLLYRHPRIAKLIRADREQAIEQALDRHAFKVMFLSRFLMGVRGPVYLAAGVVRMPFRRFLIYDLISASLVVTLFFGLAYLYGDIVADRIRHAEMTATLLLVIVLTVIGAYLYYKQGNAIYEALFGEDRPADSPVPTTSALPSENKPEKEC